jgi:hypothetical protein
MTAGFFLMFVVEGNFTERLVRSWLQVKGEYIIFGDT